MDVGKFEKLQHISEHLKDCVSMHTALERPG